MALLVGSTNIGRFPPMLFITNKKAPMVVDLKCRGTISTTTAKTIPNHISAAKEMRFVPQSKRINFSTK